MSPKRGRPSAAPKGKAPIQQQLEQLPLIKKPLELIGDHVNVPGAFWEGRMSAAEKETLYKCVVRDHSALHKFINGLTSEAFEVQELDDEWWTEMADDRGQQRGAREWASVGVVAVFTRHDGRVGN